MQEGGDSNQAIEGLKRGGKGSGRRRRHTAFRGAGGGVKGEENLRSRGGLDAQNNKTILNNGL